MAEAVDDLLWDYTGDDSSPFLQRATSPLNRSERPCGISRRQARYLYHSVSEAAQILEAELHRDRLNHERSENTSVPSSFHRLAAKFGSFLEKMSRVNFAYIPIILFILLIVAVVSESVWDAVDSNDGSHLPYAAAVLSTLCGILVIVLYAMILLKLGRRGVTLSALAISFLCSLVSFAAVYAVFFRFNSESWIPSRTSGCNFIVTYCLMLQFSVSVLTLSSGNIAPVLWYSELVVSLQMIVAYCHLVLIIATVVGVLHNARQKLVIANGGESSNQPLVRFDNDNDSIGVFDMRSESGGVESERRLARAPGGGRSPTGGVPSDVPPRAPNHSIPDADDDLLLSHSI